MAPESVVKTAFTTRYG